MATRFTACPLCEAGCGLAIDFDAGAPVRVRPDQDDPRSKGYVCPKGLELLSLERDPDRLRAPMRRGPDGAFHEITWEEAYAEIA